MCAVAKYTPRSGFRQVEAVVDPGSEESVTPPNVFPGEIRASAFNSSSPVSVVLPPLPDVKPVLCRDQIERAMGDVGDPRIATGEERNTEFIAE